MTRPRLTAAQRRIGVIVRMVPTAYPILVGRARSRYAIVVGTSRSPLGIIVRRDGLKGRERWAACFWERVHINRRVFLKRHPGLRAALTGR